MNKNKKECIEDLNYIRKALTKGSLYQHDAIILLIDTIARYLFVDAVNLVDDEKAARMNKEKLREDSGDIEAMLKGEKQ